MQFVSDCPLNASNSIHTSCKILAYLLEAFVFVSHFSKRDWCMLLYVYEDVFRIENIADKNKSRSLFELLFKIQRIHSL
jgi:hypothetical protein